MIVFGREEFDMTIQDANDLYQNKITPTERKYFDCWSKWKRYKIPPWRFLNQRKVTRDMYLALDQIEDMYNERVKVKEHKDKIAADQMQFRPFDPHHQTQQRPRRVQSVL